MAKVSTDPYIRKITEDEMEKIIINELEFHEYIDEEINLPEEDFERMRDDILLNGLLNPITLLDGKLIDGRVRWYILVGEDYDFKVQYNEYIGPKDKGSVSEWLARTNHYRTHDTTEMKLVRGIEDILPIIDKIRATGRYKGVETNQIIATEVGLKSKETVRKGINIRKNYSELYELMKRGDISLEDAYKIFYPKKWKDLTWINRMLVILKDENKYSYKINQLVDAHKIIRDKFNKELEKQIEVENNKIKAEFEKSCVKAKPFKMIKRSRTRKQYRNREKIKSYSLRIDDRGLKLLDEFVKKLKLIGIRIKLSELNVDKISIEQLEKETEAYKVKEMAQDEKIEKEYQQYIGGKLPYQVKR